jgi:predicted nucleic acid-binding protein
LIVVDASILGPALLDDAPDGDRVRQRLAGERLAAPALIDLEVMSMLKRAARQRRLEEGRARRAVANLIAIPLSRMPHVPLLPRIWELRHNLSSYDAAYVALAEAIGAALLTADRGLAAAAGNHAEVEVLA